MRIFARVGLVGLMGLSMAASYAADSRPLDEIIKFDSLSENYRSLHDPVTREKMSEYDAVALKENSTGKALNEHRGHHQVKAVRFMQIPEGMAAADVVKAWRDVGGTPVVDKSANGGPYTSAHDETHYVTDAFISTAYICAKSGPPDGQYVELWARQFLFVKADGTVISGGHPPDCK